jgi:hypothetical protein
VWRYERSLEEVVVEICRVAVQYCRRYYPSPDGISELVSLVLESVFNPADRANAYKLRLSIDVDTTTFVLIPRKTIWALALADRVNLKGLGTCGPSLTKVSRYIEQRIKRAGALDHDVITYLVTPALIERWLRSTDCNPEVFFDLMEWKLSLWPEPVDRQNPKE